MKRLALFFTALSLPLLGSDELWFTDLDAAQTQAATDGKSLLIDFTDLDN